MFLDAVLARNPKLISLALSLHREQVIPPNCFVIDLDSVVENAHLLKEAALQNGLSLYFTTKQVGFNPLVAQHVSEAGILKAIAIDYREAAMLAQNRVPIGHVGHLVQIPQQMIDPILKLEPEVVTVFSTEKAEQISRSAVRGGQEVGLLLRVISEKDYFYTGQEGGICLDQLLQEASTILKLPHVRIAGVTSYPCLQLDEGSQTLKPAQNFTTILKATEILREGLGIVVEQINAPGNTCVASMPLLAQMGATHGEPGHALTGTTYLHTQLQQAELPAMVYVSEVSHVLDGKVYIFGGGTHRRAKIRKALIGTVYDRLIKTEVLAIDPTTIDYYIALSKPDGPVVRVGDTVILASRAQIFVSRSYVAIVKGIQTGNPTFMGLFDAWGKAVENIF